MGNECEKAKVSRDGISQLGSLQDFLKTRKFGVIALVAIGVMVLVIIVDGPPQEEEAAPTVPVSEPSGAESGQAETTLPIYYSQQGNDVAKKPSSGAQAAAVKLAGPKLFKRPRDIKIPPGVLVSAVLVSGASNGPVKAMLKESLKVNGEEVIESSAVILGVGTSSEERLFVRFDKIIFKDGTVQGIQADAADSSDKIPGLKGSKVGHYALKLAGSVGLNFASGMADGLQDTDTNGFVAVKKPTVKNALLNGASRAALEQGADMMTSLKNDKPIIEVPEGTAIFVLFSGQEGG